jgi:hypothetical protein
MGISANFVFLQQEFPHAAKSASLAEQRIYGDRVSMLGML